MKHFVITKDKYYTLDMRKFKKGKSFEIKDGIVIDHNGKILCDTHSEFAKNFGKIIEKDGDGNGK